FGFRGTGWVPRAGNARRSLGRPRFSGICLRRPQAEAQIGATINYPRRAALVKRTRAADATYFRTSFLIVTQELAVARIMNTRADGPMFSTAISEPSGPAGAEPLYIRAATMVHDSLQYWTVSYIPEQPIAVFGEK